jgi:hypothetical protein
MASRSRRPKASAPHGTGLQAGARKYDDNKPNAPTAIVELFKGAQSAGVWIVNLNLTENFDAQELKDDGKTYQLSLRRVRHYVPFTLRLDQVHPREIPGNEHRLAASRAT